MSPGESNPQTSLHRSPAQYVAPSKVRDFIVHVSMALRDAFGLGTWVRNRKVKEQVPIIDTKVRAVRTLPAPSNLAETNREKASASDHCEHLGAER